MIGLSCYILADTFFVSKGLGANGITALNLAIPIYSFIHGSGLMIGMGGATKYSILKSQNKIEDANRVFSNAVFLTILFAISFFFMGVFFSGGITRLLGADEVVYRMCKTYLQVILLFAPMFLFNNVLLCFVRNEGAPQLTMMAMLIGSFSNIILDYVFIFPCNMGIFGAVLATGVAPIISMLVLLKFFIKKQNGFHFIKCKIVGDYVMSTIFGGLPSLITEVSSGIVIIIFNSIILRLTGNIGVAAYGIIANISLVIISIYTGIAQGIQPIISKNYGTGNKDSIKAILRYALIIMVLLSVVIYAVIFFGASPIASIFNSEQNMVLQDIAEKGLRLYFTACVFAGFNIILSIYFASIEKVKPAHAISLMRGFVIIIPMAFILSTVAGITGVWCTFPVTEGIVCFLGMAWYFFSNN